MLDPIGIARAVESLVMASNDLPFFFPQPELFKDIGLDEATMLRWHRQFEAKYLMSLAMANAGRLGKFGA